jgi:AcrR family transcriptional regulator
VSVITHHFGTREGLIAELHARRFASISARDHEALQHLVEGATTRAEFAAGVAAITAATFDDSRSEDRFARLVSIGAMHGRPELAAAIRQEATVMIDRVTQVIETGQSRGLVAADVDPRAVATFIRAYALGMVERYLDDRPTSRVAVVEVILRAVGVFMTEPDSA